MTVDANLFHLNANKNFSFVSDTEYCEPNFLSDNLYFLTLVKLAESKSWYHVNNFQLSKIILKIRALLSCFRTIL